ncbi:MAG: 4-hydroxythreonine-4-phosphate dehydrogenase PdxA [candidate division WOR-3 bacterium]
MHKIFIAPGDPFGVGPEILIKSLSKIKLTSFEIIIGSDPDFFIKKTKEFKINLDNKNISFDGIYKIKKGEKNYPTLKGAKFSIESLNWAIEKVKKEKGVLLTGPVSKEMIRKLIPNFLGQTEYICEKINKDPSKVIMSFYFKDKFLGLFTQHIPLKEVFKFIDPAFYLKRLRVFKREIKKIIRKNPKIALLSLNPHGEEFGEEEKFLKNYIKFKKNLKGFFPSDSFFGYSLYKDFDAIFAFYHDQGTIPSKILGPSVHLSLGLPFLRISPDHGPAYNMKGKANYKSILNCFKFIKKYFTLFE